MLTGCTQELPAWLAVVPLNRLTIHWSAVDLSKFRMLTRWCRVGSFSCSLNNMSAVPKLRLPSLRRHFVGFPRSTSDFVPTFHGFVRAAIFLHALAIVCVFFPSLCTTQGVVCVHHGSMYTCEMDVCFGIHSIRKGCRHVLSCHYG